MAKFRPGSNLLLLLDGEALNLSLSLSISTQVDQLKMRLSIGYKLSPAQIAINLGGRDELRHSNCGAPLGYLSSSWPLMSPITSLVCAKRLPRMSSRCFDLLSRGHSIAVRRLQLNVQQQSSFPIASSLIEPPRKESSFTWPGIRIR